MIPLPANVVEALGWTLLHSLWQGASIAAALWTALLFLRKASPQARYLASCTALALMALCPIATFGVLYQPTPAEPTALITSEMRTIEIAASPEASDRPALPRDTLAPSTQVPTTPTTISPLGGVELQATLARSHPYLVSAWLIGVLLLAARLLAQYLYLHRLRRRATPAPAIWQHHLEVLAHRLDLKQTVALLTSSPLDTPAVLGFLKPAVLLPASALTGLSREQLEAILAHELAHIRRYDALVNLIQTALETLLFYHPAVWWVSAQIRAEREHCCDDTAVALCGNPLAYAKALANLEGLRAAPKLAPAMSEGKLLRRIRRVVGLPVAGERPSSWVVGALLVGVLLFSGLALTLTPATASTKAPESDALHNHLAPAAAMPPDRHTIWTTVTEGVVFDEDLRILDPNGYLLLEERAGSTTRLLYVTRGDDPNDLVYKYVVNGEVQPFDNAARAWFATMRGEAIWRFLREDRGDDPLAASLRTGPPDTFTSFVRAEVAVSFIRPLSTIVYQGPDDARRPPIAGLVRAAHLRAHHLATDADLLAFLQDAHRNFDLDVPAWRELLFASMELASDELKAALLIDVAPNVPRESPAREAYLIAASSIASPELQQQVIAALE